MSEQRINGAIDRIERALIRIEVQTARARGSGDLTASHEKLKARVSASLSQLDGLIESLEG
ncbi:MAG: hypothetical protein CL575_04790 [Altererythrobacter sp.]|nr:hypothetical protein [Erythrobacter sp.]MAW91140.1 hypothetical protein [Altererythrobacter sp.]MBK62247.1 hypothetical protein [Altererythrobacter sp.]|tara:strand:- start:439 stop:621 length:183 start_codon:yes stop_codon:yes gene_type:complete